MQILKSFKDPELVGQLADRIRRQAKQRDACCLMEVCGTHTQAIGRWGLRSILPGNIRLVSGPGCPVCVTPAGYIDNAVQLGLEHDCVLATFGDLVRVPGLGMSLQEARAEGAEVHTVYSPADALELADSTDREVVFLAIGFETTIAAIAGAMKSALARNANNLTFYCSFRTVPPALKALIADPDLALDGFILPGHVSVIIGRQAYGLLNEHGVPGAIAGFEPVDILRSISALLEDVNAGRCEVRNLYPRVVREQGNPGALRLFKELFEKTDAAWRGIGTITASGLRLREEYTMLDAERRYELPPVTADSNPGCRCGDVLRGVQLPADCPLFGHQCTPDHPVGPCMVSSEGSCSAYYKYGADNR